MVKRKRIDVPSSVSVLLLLLLISLCVSGYLGFQLWQTKVLSTFVCSPFTNQDAGLSASPVSACSLSGDVSKSDYLISYTVQSGDTLLGIANFQLKDSSRVNEIVQLNKDNYPALSMYNPFLEKGWRLYLPSSSIGRSSGNLREFAGRLMRKDTIYWSINYGNATESISASAFSSIRNAASFQAGDCIKILSDVSLGKILQVTKID